MSDTYREMMHQAREMVKGAEPWPRFEQLVEDVERNCLEDQWQLRQMLDQRNWRVSRPRIMLDARRNKSGNLQLHWSMVANEHNIRSIDELEFTHDFASRISNGTEAYGAHRPEVELFWVKVRHFYGETREVEEAALNLYRMLVMRYDEIIETLEEAFEFDHVPKLEVVSGKERGIIELLFVE